MATCLLCLFTLCFAIITQLGWGQVFPTDLTHRHHALGVQVHGGVFMPHHTEMEILRERPVKALEISYAISGASAKPWHSVYNRPWYGLLYKLMDLGSPTYLGFSHSIVPYIALPFWDARGRFALSHRWGVGLGYVTRTYHRTENFKNSAIGSHLNLAANLRIEAKYRFTPDVSAFGGINLIHFSNATFKKPNLGINFASISLGTHVALQHEPLAVAAPAVPAMPRHRLLVVGAGSIKEVMGVGGPKYGVGSLSLEYTLPWEPLKRYGISLDFMYSPALRILMEMDGHHPITPWDILRVGTTLNLEFMLNRLSAGLYLGAYLHNVGDYPGNLYHRLGLRYQLHPRIWAHAMLKTHWFSADYLEIGFAYRIV